MFFGDKLPVETALAWGLVNRVVGKGEALPTALALARELAARAGAALQLCKQSIDTSFDMAEESAVRASLAMTERVFTSADCAEGVDAFFARRPPRFTHR